MGPVPAGVWLDGDQQRAWPAYIRVQLRLAYEMNRGLLADSGQRPGDEVLRPFDRLPRAGDGGGGEQQQLGVGSLIVVRRPCTLPLAGDQRLRGNGAACRGRRAEDRSGVTARATRRNLLGRSWQA